MTIAPPKPVRIYRVVASQEGTAPSPEKPKPTFTRDRIYLACGCEAIFEVFPDGTEKLIPLHIHGCTGKER